MIGQRVSGDERDDSCSTITSFRLHGRPALWNNWYFPLQLRRCRRLPGYSGLSGLFVWCCLVCFGPLRAKVLRCPIWLLPCMVDTARGAESVVCMCVCVRETKAKLLNPLSRCSGLRSAVKLCNIICYINMLYEYAI